MGAGVRLAAGFGRARPPDRAVGQQRRHHCAEGQGFLFSHPVSAENFGDLLRLGISSPINTLYQATGS